jgi:hypothetical protein
MFRALQARYRIEAAVDAELTLASDDGQLSRAREAALSFRLA